MLRLALVGYGKMGRLLEQLAPQEGFEVVVRLRSGDNLAGRAINAPLSEAVDVAIEFSTPEAAVGNLLRLAEAGIPTVTGTTGWLGKLDEVSNAFHRSRVGLVWSPNFSYGVAVFRRLVESAAQLISGNQTYGAWAWEIHHDQKKDALSGTILQLVETMRKAGYDREISISSNRAGRHPGTHEIGFDSAADTITLRHAARTREGFALGALKSAAWVVGRSGVYTFEDVLFGPQR